MIFYSSFSVGLSLFDDTMYRSLVADKKAYLLGDPLTVLVMENSNAQSSADLASSKDIHTALEASYDQNKYEAGLGLKGKGSASAKTERNGKIKAALTVRITHILPHDCYYVEGRQLIQVNQEQQTILLSGLVRQEDISSQNTILSTRIANAKISYRGQGAVSTSQRNNIIYNALSFMGLV